LNKKLIVALVMSSVVASSFALTASAKMDKNVLKDEQGSIHNVVGKLGKVSGRTPEEIAINAMDLVKDEYGFDKAAGKFKVKSSQKDVNGVTHTRLDRVINGIPVEGDDMIVHEKNGVVLGVTGKFSKEPTTLSKADLNDPTLALDVAVDYTGYTGELNEPATAQPVYLPKNGEMKLAYKVKVNYMANEPGKWTIYVSAEDNTVLDAINEIEYAKPVGVGSTGGTPAVGTGVGVLGDKKTINTTLSNGVYTLVDQTKYMHQMNGNNIVTKNFNNGTRMSDFTDSDNNWDASVQRAGVDAHYYAGQVYDYYYTQLGRNSYDNAGHEILSGVHYGSRYNNAFWDGRQMVYGDGDGVTFIALSGGLDVVAHELTHAVTDSTSDLVYRDQSGALNESWSDAMASVIDSGDWLIGEDVYTPGKPGDALRSMSNPNAYGDPEHMSQYVNTTSDNGGVHTNSGIPNKAFYNFATAVNSRTIAGKVWYTAARDYMTSSTNFSGARAATLQAAAALYGANSTVYTDLQNAWSAVGVY